MKAAEIKDVRLGDVPVMHIMLGDRIVYDRGADDRYLSVRPETLWIVDDIPYVVEVLSNTAWSVE